MTQRKFVQRRAPGWQELETLLQRVSRHGVKTLSPEEIDHFGTLYRGLGSDLAYARGRYEPQLVEYLNRTLARAHAIVYAPTSHSGWSRIKHFYTHDFPAEFRRSIVPIALCTALTVASAVMSYVIVRTHPGNAFALMPSELIPAHIRKSLHDSNFAFSAQLAPMMSAFIITNNVRVAMIAFAGAATLGALTVYIIAFNGLMLGTLGGLFTNAGFGTDFWVTISPHGVIELLAIQIAGAAGLLIAAGVLAPGRLKRKDAMVLNARRAAILFGGVCSMLLVAGTIEGFVSPQRWPMDARASVGALTAAVLFLYFTFTGRARPITEDRAA
jgi:uncharacterized membrane protein SpoIIM required for sporulation